MQKASKQSGVARLQEQGLVVRAALGEVGTRWGRAARPVRNLVFVLEI